MKNFVLIILMVASPLLGASLPAELKIDFLALLQRANEAGINKPNNITDAQTQLNSLVSSSHVVKQLTHLIEVERWLLNGNRQDFEAMPRGEFYEYCQKCKVSWGAVKPDDWEIVNRTRGQFAPISKNLKDRVGGVALTCGLGGMVVIPFVSAGVASLGALLTSRSSIPGISHPWLHNVGIAVGAGLCALVVGAVVTKMCKARDRAIFPFVMTALIAAATAGVGVVGLVGGFAHQSYDLITVPGRQLSDYVWPERLWYPGVPIFLFTGVSLPCATGTTMLWLKYNDDHLSPLYWLYYMRSRVLVMSSKELFNKADKSQYIFMMEGLYKDIPHLGGILEYFFSLIQRGEGTKVLMDSPQTPAFSEPP